MRAATQDDLAKADPAQYLLAAATCPPTESRDYYQQAALVEAVMLLTHRVGELARVVDRLEKKL